jgi:prepilin-type N-terminal cleavage/methylation domain-containing protein
VKSYHPKIINKLRSGMTLVEVLITVVVLAVGCLAALRLQLASTTTRSYAFHVTEASYLVKAEIERLKSLNRSELETESDAKVKTENGLNAQGLTCLDGNCHGNRYARTVRYYPKVPTSLSVQVEVEVSWLDSSGPQKFKQWAILTWLTF